MLGQLSYPGRQALAAVARKTVIAPSVVPFGKFCVDHEITRFVVTDSLTTATDALNATFAKTREATQADIEFLTRGFVHAAKYLEAAGFDGI